MTAKGLNPLLSEAGFSTRVTAHNTAAMAAGLNPLLSEAGFSTRSARRVAGTRRVVLILF